MAQITIAQDIVRRYRWFRLHAGCNASSALQLARAEAWLRDQDIEPVTEPEQDVDLSWMTDEERAQPHEVEVYALVRPCPDHGLNCRHAEWLASVGNVVDADQVYGRVLFAELASELM